MRSLDDFDFAVFQASGFGSASQFQSVCQNLLEPLVKHRVLQPIQRLMGLRLVLLRRFLQKLAALGCRRMQPALFCTHSSTETMSCQLVSSSWKRLPIFLLKLRFFADYLGFFFADVLSVFEVLD